MRKKNTVDANPKIYLSGIRLLFFHDLRSFSVIDQLAAFLLWEPDEDWYATLLSKYCKCIRDFFIPVKI